MRLVFAALFALHVGLLLCWLSLPGCAHRPEHPQLDKNRQLLEMQKVALRRFDLTPDSALQARFTLCYIACQKAIHRGEDLIKADAALARAKREQMATDDLKGDAAEALRKAIAARKEAHQACLAAGIDPDEIHAPPAATDGGADAGPPGPADGGSTPPPAPDAGARDAGARG